MDGNADKITNDIAIIANKFNLFFAKVGPNLAQKLSSAISDITEYLSGQYPNSMFNVGTNENEIITMLKSKNSKKCNYGNSQSIIHYQWFIYNWNIL